MPTRKKRYATIPRRVDPKFPIYRSLPTVGLSTKLQIESDLKRAEKVIMADLRRGVAGIIKRTKKKIMKSVKKAPKAKPKAKPRAKTTKKKTAKKK